MSSLSVAWRCIKATNPRSFHFFSPNLIRIIKFRRAASRACEEEIDEKQKKLLKKQVWNFQRKKSLVSNETYGAVQNLEKPEKDQITWRVFCLYQTKKKKNRAE